MEHKESNKKPTPPRGNKTHVGLLALVGIYFLYMGGQMLRNALTGATTMSLTTTVLLVVVMGLIALGIFAYAIWLWICLKRYEQEEEEEEQEE